jgi:MoxR-like ATPase
MFVHGHHQARDRTRARRARPGLSAPPDTIAAVSENRERIRIVGSVPVDDDTTIWIDHVFAMGASPHDDPGYVGLTVTEDDTRATCLLTAQEALLLADRLQRAAHLVLETDEDLPDPEREYRRHRGDGAAAQPG